MRLSYQLHDEEHNFFYDLRVSPLNRPGKMSTDAQILESLHRALEIDCSKFSNLYRVKKRRI